MMLSSGQIIVSWKERSRSDITVKLSLTFSLRSLRLVELFELYTTQAIIEAKTITKVRAQDRA